MGANTVTKGRAKIGAASVRIIASVTFTWDPGSLADGAGETKADIAAAGAAFGDVVVLSAPYTLAGVTLSAYVHSAGVVAGRLQNESGGVVDLVSGTWRATVLRFQ